MTKFFFMAAVVAIASSCGTDERSNRTNPHQKGLALTKVCDEGQKAVLDQLAAFKHSAKNRYCVKYVWLHGPMVSDYNRARLTIVAPDLSAPVKIKNVSVTPWMKIHDHGTGDVQPELAPVNE